MLETKPRAFRPVSSSLELDARYTGLVLQYLLRMGVTRRGARWTPCQMLRRWKATIDELPHPAWSRNSPVDAYLAFGSR